jgi:Flp pilus assembly protein TadD
VSGYVVCTACGTRIKAGRGHCLRCFEPLPDPGTPILPPIWESLSLSQGKLMIVGAVFAVLVVSLGTMIWKTWPTELDDIARPVGAATAPAPASAEVSDEPVTWPGYLPISAVAADSPRSGSAAAIGDPAAARAVFERAVADNPNDPEAANNLGKTLVTLGRTGEAIKRFERAVAIAPTEPAYHFNVAWASAQLGDPERAIREYREALQRSPNAYASEFNLAMALHESGDLEAAIAGFQRAIVLAPSESTFHMALGLSLEQAGRFADADREYRQFIQMAPTSPDAGRLRAHIEVLSGRPTGRPPS